MIVSGDVFHVATPNIETQTMFVDELLNIHNQCDSMSIVVTAGNHDSYSRLEIDKNLWKRHNIHIIGNVSSSVEQHLINIKGKGIRDLLRMLTLATSPTAGITSTISMLMCW